VQLSLNAPNQSPGYVGSFGVNLSARVTSKTEATQNTGSLAFFDSGAGNMATPTSPLCTLGIPAGQQGITKEPGALFATLTCPLIISVDGPGDGCRVSGTIAIEYCKTGEEDD
jgi:hypothetical protein